MLHKGGLGVRKNDTECHTGGGGSKKCVKSVMSYLNCPNEVEHERWIGG